MNVRMNEQLSKVGMLHVSEHLPQVDVSGLVACCLVACGQVACGLLAYRTADGYRPVACRNGCLWLG